MFIYIYGIYPCACKLIRPRMHVCVSKFGPIRLLIVLLFLTNLASI